MAKGKSKTDFKQLLLKKGEYIAMGLAGLLLVIFLGWGISHWAGKDDPDKISKDLTTKAQGVTAKINSTELSPDDIALGALPDWLKKESKFDQVSVRDFPLTTPPFDVTGKPDTKRENPTVLTLGNYQVDLIRVPMRGYDIVYTKGDEEPLIAMITSKTVSEQDKDLRKKLGNPLRDRSKKGQESRTRLGNQPPAGGGQPPAGGGGQPPAPGGGGKPPGGGSQGPAPGYRHRAASHRHRAPGADRPHRRAVARLPRGVGSPAASAIPGPSSSGRGGGCPTSSVDPCLARSRFSR